MTDLSTVALEALARSDTTTRHLIAQEMRNPAFPAGAIRTVNYDYDISINGDPYVGIAMDTQIPEVGTDPDNEIRLRMDGIGSTMQFYMNQANDQGEPVFVTLISLLFNIETETIVDIMGTWEYELKAVQYDMSSVMPQLGNVSPTNQSFPGIKYSATSHPALYR